jgi:N-acyl amino acid synthase FeeM
MSFFYVPRQLRVGSQHAFFQLCLADVSAPLGHAAKRGRMDKGFSNGTGPCPIRVAALARDVRVKIASTRAEWEEAFALAANGYQARGYQPPNPKGLRFTTYHALPDTTTFVAKNDQVVIATLSLVLDNTLLGLPMESIYGAEIDRLRAAGKHVVEVTSLAGGGLSVREFVPVFVALMRLMTQYAVSQGADAMVISVHPRHRNFYQKVLGFVPLGACRAYPAVEDHPAEGHFLDPDLLRTKAPPMHQVMLGERLPPQALVPTRMPKHLVQYFGSRSTPDCSQLIVEILAFVGACGNPRRW